MIELKITYKQESLTKILLRMLGRFCASLFLALFLALAFRDYTEGWVYWLYKVLDRSVSVLFGYLLFGDCILLWTNIRSWWKRKQEKKDEEEEEENVRTETFRLV